jgi:hypothetical protein
LSPEIRIQRMMIAVDYSEPDMAGGVFDMSPRSAQLHSITSPTTSIIQKM